MIATDKRVTRPQARAAFVSLVISSPALSSNISKTTKGCPTSLIRNPSPPKLVGVQVRFEWI